VSETIKEEFSVMEKAVDGDFGGVEVESKEIVF